MPFDIWSSAHIIFQILDLVDKRGLMFLGVEIVACIINRDWDVEGFLLCELLRDSIDQKKFPYLRQGRWISKMLLFAENVANLNESMLPELASPLLVLKNELNFSIYAAAKRV